MSSALSLQKTQTIAYLGPEATFTCSLPLAEGYQTTFRNLDVQRQKVALKQFKVTGVEEVHPEFHPRFDAVVLLSAPVEVLLDAHDRQPP